MPPKDADLSVHKNPFQIYRSVRPSAVELQWRSYGIHVADGHVAVFEAVRIFHTSTDENSIDDKASNEIEIEETAIKVEWYSFKPYSELYKCRLFLCCFISIPFSMN